jgi:thioredoxin-related protein
MMKRAVILIFLSPLFLLAQTDSNQGIKWAKGLSWEQIKEKAKQENKFIFVDAFATWCGPCKKMDKEIYTDQGVGEVVNQNFLSVKVQMDQTSNDNEMIKSWYGVAQTLNGYGIDGYPSFLFFSPDGKLAYKAVGFLDKERFIALTKEALTDPNTRYAKSIEKFKSQQLAYDEMPDLARQALAKKDKETSIKIVKQYKEQYVDKLDDEKAFASENLSILGQFSIEVLSSKDRYFKFFNEHSDEADSIVGWTLRGKPRKVAKLFVRTVIRKEEISDKLYQDGKPITNPKPNWKKIEKSIIIKYGSYYADQYFPDEQIEFYRVAQDWNNYVIYVNKKIKKMPPRANGRLFGLQFGDSWQLNMYGWVLFEGCTDKNILKKGLPWVDLSLKLKEVVYVIDTKANLLYRIGKVKEAIALEESAVNLSNNDKSTIETLNKMKAGYPTWPITND